MSLHSVPPNRPGEPPAETRVAVWRAYARAVAGLHRQNELRPDLDQVNRVAYDPSSQAVTFPDLPGFGAPGDEADVEALARNLMPLMQFVLGQKAGLWEVFEQEYLDRMDGRGQRVLDLLRTARSEARRAHEIGLRALGLAYLQRQAEAEAAFSESLRIRQAIGDDDGYCRTLCNLALSQADAGRLPDALRTVERAIIWGRGHGRVKGLSLALLQKALLLNRKGDREAARQTIELAVESWRETAQPLPSQFAEAAEAIRSGRQPKNGGISEP